MADWIALILVALALYLVECLAWIGRDAVACFRHPISGSWKTSTGARLPGNDRGGVTLASPLTTAGGLVVSRSWPIAIDPDGIASGDTERYVRFDDITSVRMQLDELRINGQRFARVSPQPFGEHLAEQIQRVRRSARATRTAKIRSAIADSLDREAVAASWAAFQQRVRFLAALCSTHVIVTFVVSPLALLLVGPIPSWPYLLAAVMLLAVAIAVAYFRLHRAIYPSDGSDRWVHAVSMVLLPVAAMRCVDKLSRDVLCVYSPFAVAPAVSGADAARPTLRAAWIDLATPAHEQTTPAARCVEWFRSILAKETHAVLERSGIDVLAPPTAEDDMVFYCPRCHAQFGEGAVEHCSECLDVRLVRFAAA